MRNRRYLPTSDDEDDHAPPQHSPPEMRSSHRRKKRGKVSDDEEEEAIQQVAKAIRKEKRLKHDEDEKKKVSPSVDDMEEEEEEEEETPAEDAKPIGDVVRVSGKGKTRRNHYKAFELDGMSYEIEDPVLLVPEGENKKPYVAIIKDITETKEGSVMVTGQWFYRPEEADKKNGGNWQSRDTRELFYSFHRDEVPAESVMHKCRVHFIPANKQIPSRKVHPGFIVQKVYDTILKRLFKLTDKDYEDNKQHEVDLLVQKTMSQLGDLPDIKFDEDTVDLEERLRSKRLSRRKNMSLLDVTRDEDFKSWGPLSKSETPGSANSISSEYYNILVKFDVVTSESTRAKWLEKLLEGVQYVCNNADGSRSIGKDNNGANNHLPPNDPEEKIPLWPDDAVRAVAAIEQASYESLSSDYLKYNQKMRQLHFNLKKNAQLARRLLNKELEPSKILNMTPTELKEGLTKEERASKEPEEDVQVQMTSARCKRCSDSTEKKVRLIEIITAGHLDRYQLECITCGNSWYASRDEASTLTIDEPSSVKSVGSTPGATAKFEDVEKKLLSPREHSTNESLKKVNEPIARVPERLKSFNKSRPEEKDNQPPPTDRVD